MFKGIIIVLSNHQQISKKLFNENFLSGRSSKFVIVFGFILYKPEERESIKIKKCVLKDESEYKDDVDCVMSASDVVWYNNQYENL